MCSIVNLRLKFRIIFVAIIVTMNLQMNLQMDIIKFQKSHSPSFLIVINDTVVLKYFR